MDSAANVGEALISASVQTLLDQIASREFRDFMKHRKLNVSLLDEMKKTLLVIGAVLNDAEEKQISSPSVKEWLQGLKDAVYDAEDLMDEINTESLRCKVEQDSQNIANKVRSFFSSPFGGFHKGMNSKLEETSRRFQHFAKQKDIHGLQSVSLRAHKTPTTPLLNESVVVGRDDDREKLMKMLLCDEDPKGNAIGVISIWGVGGLGKTTLAQLLYQDSNVSEHFDLKAWVCVSDDFNVFEVTKNLVESITSKVYDTRNLDFLRVELRNSLSNKKFLIVLDDLWNEKCSDWDNLITPFHSGRKGSKIMVTTRQQRVVEITRTFPEHKLNCLSEDDCWVLLSKHAFGSEDPNKYPELEAIGKQIARKCGGLPIAARTIGGLLLSKVDEEEWNKILNSNQWDIPNDDVLPALHLSYLYLPSHLKKCFVYCSIFPKDLVLEKKKMILLWMAEGVVQQHSHGEMTFEMVAEEYFNELLSRSFFQQYGGHQREFVMHDLINDLAKFVSGKNCIQFEGKEVPKVARHLSFPKKKYTCLKDYESFYHLNCLRTLVSQNEFKDGSSKCFLTKKVLHDLLTKLKCLRVLSSSGYSNVIEVPNSIGNLQHLRYLNLSYTSIRRLPDVVFTLYNLQTLLLSNCEYFNELSEKIGKLINLNHLDISGTALKEMPTQITKLQNLQGLSTFVVGKRPNGLGIKELKSLPHLEGKLSILKLQNVVDSMDALEANLKMREKIEEFVLEWDSDAQDSQTVKNVLDMLQPSTYLKRLTIKNYGGTCFPIWVGDSSFKNLTFLCVSDCDYCFSLPTFGELPSLNELSIKGMALIHTVGCDFYLSKAECSSVQPFPSLESLTFENMPIWEEWRLFEGEGAKFPFPQLKHLTLHDCPMLKGDMPSNLPSLTMVSISNCKQLMAKSTALHRTTSIEELKIEQGEEGLLREPDPSLAMGSISNCKQLEAKSTALHRTTSIEELKDEQGEEGLIREPDPALTVDSIANCKQLEEKSATLHRTTSIEELTVEQGEEGLLREPDPSLTVDSIANCKQLEAKSTTLHRTTSIEELKVEQGEEGLLREPDPSLTTVSISNCKQLEAKSTELHQTTSIEELKIKQGEEGLLREPDPSLTMDSISNCKQLEAKSTALHWTTSIEELKIEQAEEGLLRELDHFSLDSLKSLTIDKCDSLQSLPRMIISGHCLRELTLKDIPSIMSFPSEGLPTSLQRLEIVSCEKLEFLPEDSWQKYTSLENLRIHNSCHSLKSFPLGCFPKLKWIYIDNCDNLKTFTHVEGSTLPLESLEVQHCEELGSMSEVHIDSLANLQIFVLNHVPKLESLPQGGLPSHLRSFTIDSCNGLSSTSIEDWGFPRLIYLSHFEVMNDESILHNLLKNQLLPSSLVYINISGASNLKLLERKGFKHLTCLEQLYIWDCPNLESLPEDALPPSLLLLDIRRCPKLEERYDYQRGKHLSKIAHIPTIQINGEYYDP